MRLGAWLRAVFRNRRGGIPRPAWCTYLVTWRCNARCPMCDSWRLKPSAELTPAQVGDVFRKIGRLDVVRLTGGEPFLRADLPEIAAAVLLASRPRVLHVSTNGSFPDRVADFVHRFPEPRRLRLMVSLDGLEAEHNRSRGRAASFARATETVATLAALRAVYGCEVSVNHTVVSRQSLADHDELRARLNEIGVEMHTVLAYADSAMYGRDLQGRAAEHLIVPLGYPLHPALEGADAIGFVKAELRDVRQYRSRLLRHGKRYYLRGLLARLRKEPNPRPRPRCVALRSHLRLLPDGRVPVCQFNTQVVADLRREPLEAVWQNGRLAAARAWVDRCPGCWAECEVIPNAIYSGDILRA